MSYTIDGISVSALSLRSLSPSIEKRLCESLVGRTRESGEHGEKEGRKAGDAQYTEVGEALVVSWGELLQLRALDGPVEVCKWSDADYVSSSDYSTA